MLGNVALALGPWSVRLADSGPVSAGFWRLALALPLLALLVRANRQPLRGLPRGVLIALAAGGVLFALDIASWHLGIGRTRLGNASLFGNSGSVILMGWGLASRRRLPRIGEVAAIAATLLGAWLLFARSLAVSSVSLTGDLLCVLAGLFYAFYIVLLARARDGLGNWAALTLASAAGAPVLLGIALALGEPVWPGFGHGVHGAWWLGGWSPLLALALGSQIIGQGLLVYALRHFTPLVIGLALLTQPAVAVAAGWLAFGEALTAQDALGMALIAAALVLVRAGGSEAVPE